MTLDRDLNKMIELARFRDAIPVEDARVLIKKSTAVFRALMLEVGHDKRQVQKLITKFRDAGRRSPPWRQTSQRVPGRPQDGADGNRINRWKLPEDHKFAADETTATLVEVRYYLQALSMDGAPEFDDTRIHHAFEWLVGHDVRPGEYVDPIQMVPISIHEIVDDAKLIQSGHYVPLDRGGRHEPSNAFLMLARSNQLQGNLRVDELIELMDRIVVRHKTEG